MLKRIFLFILTNIAIIVLGTLILFLLEILFGINIRGTLHTSYLSLAIFALFYGFFASFVSLFLSRWMAKRAYSMLLLTEESLTSFSDKEQRIYRLIASLSHKNEIRMPEVGIYQSPEINAFATGATKNTSLVAVSSGLLEKMNEDEIEGVVAHEMAHILNGDMVTMTLLQGVINAFVIFLSRAIAQIVSLTGRGDSEGRNHLIYFVTTIVLEILLGIAGTLIVMAYSRRREFAADAGSATFVGKTKMISALRALQRFHEKNTIFASDTQLATMKIDGKSSGFLHLFASHPSLEERIERLSSTL